MYELNRHKKSDAIKWVIVFVSILVIITLVLAILSSGFTNWNVKTWFGQKDETEQTDEKKTVTDGNGNVLDKDVNELPSSGMVFYSSVAESTTYNSSNSVTVTATISPATADNKLVDWSVSWVNASSSWASGKTATDYVTVSPSSDGSLTATISCKDAFGEQINVVVTSRQNPEAKASVPVDYVQRHTVIGAAVIVNGTNYNISNAQAIPLVDNATLSVKTEASAGTISTTPSVSVDVCFAGAFVSALYNEYSGGYFGDLGSNKFATITDTFSVVELFENIIYAVHDDVRAAEGDEWVYSDMSSFVKNKYSGDIFEFKCNVKNGENGETSSSTYFVNLDRNSMIVSVANIAVSPGSIKF